MLLNRFLVLVVNCIGVCLCVDCPAGSYTVLPEPLHVSVSRSDFLYNISREFYFRFYLSNNSPHISVTKGQVVVFHSQPYGTAQERFNIFLRYKLTTYTFLRVLKSDFNSSYTGTVLADLLPAAIYVVSSDFYNNGVSGQNTFDISWNTSNTPSGLYYMSGGVLDQTLNNMNLAQLTVFVASPEPTTIDVELERWAVNMVAACVGDVLVVHKPLDSSSIENQYIACQLLTAEAPTGGKGKGSMFTEIANGPPPFYWTVPELGGKQCYIFNGHSSSNPYYALIVIYPRPATASVPSCQQCPAGYYTSSVGTSSCTQCPDGFTSDSGASQCTAISIVAQATTAQPTTSTTAQPTTTTPVQIPCAAGTFSLFPDSSACQNCSAGTYSSFSGSSVCQNCSAGTYSSFSGSSACQNCSAGNYTAIRATGCLQCDSGYTSLQASDECTLIPSCSIGSYGTPPDCSPCPPNTNSSVNHTSNLLDCRCLPGFICSYTKRINVRLTLKNITWDMLTLSGIANSPVIDAIAKAAGVPKENVIINGIFTSPSARRMMRGQFLGDVRQPKDSTPPSSAATDPPTIWATILEATTFDDALATTLLDKYPVDSLSWTYGHSVRVAREWASLM